MSSKAELVRVIRQQETYIETLEEKLEAVRGAVGNEDTEGEFDQTQERSNGLFGFGRSKSESANQGQEYGYAAQHKQDDYLDIYPSETFIAANKTAALKKAKQLLRARLAESRDGFRGERDSSRYKVVVFRSDED